MALPALPNTLLAALAPAQLTSFRDERYAGDKMDASLADFTPADQQIIHEAYAAIDTLYQATAGQPPSLALQNTLREIYSTQGWANLTVRLRKLGSEHNYDHPRLYQIIHDIRGGAFQALALLMQLSAAGHLDATDTGRVFLLARDQMKIIRNGVRDIDPERSQRDQTTRLHGVNLLLEKWSDTLYRYGEHEVCVDASSSYDGAIAERCLEFSALDRLLYNLMNNACTHSAGPVVWLLLSAHGDHPTNLRLLVVNQISPEQRRTLAERFTNDPGNLFLGGFSTTGSGLGMRIAADFVCNAYGIGDVAHGLAGGYFGAAVHDDLFIAWAHWPIVA